MCLSLLCFGHQNIKIMEKKHCLSFAYSNYQDDLLESRCNIFKIYRVKSFSLVDSVSKVKACCNELLYTYCILNWRKFLNKSSYLVTRNYLNPLMVQKSGPDLGIDSGNQDLWKMINYHAQVLFGCDLSSILCI